MNDYKQQLHEKTGRMREMMDEYNAYHNQHYPRFKRHTYYVWISLAVWLLWIWSGVYHKPSPAMQYTALPTYTIAIGCCLFVQFKFNRACRQRLLALNAVRVEADTIVAKMKQEVDNIKGQL